MQTWTVVGAWSVALCVALAGCSDGGGSGGDAGAEGGGGGDGDSAAAGDATGAGDSAEGGADGAAGGDASGNGDSSGVADSLEDFDTINVELPDSGDWSEPDIASAFIGGEYVEFDSYCRISFIADPEAPEGPGTITVAMTAGIIQIELQISPVVKDWEGTSDTNSGAPGALLLYNDGSILPGDAQFKYAAGGNAGGTWELTLEENSGKGGRAKGTFSGEMNLLAGEGPDILFVTDGEFDCAYP